MPMRRKDKELSKYSKYKARVDLTKSRTSSEHARVARSLVGVPLEGLHSLASARVYLCWLCVRFQTARVASCHGRDSGFDFHDDVHTVVGMAIMDPDV